MIPLVWGRRSWREFPGVKQQAVALLRSECSAFQLLHGVHHLFNGFKCKRIKACVAQSEQALTVCTGFQLLCYDFLLGPTNPSDRLIWNR